MHVKYPALLALLCCAGLAAAQPSTQAQPAAPQTLGELSARAREARLKGDVPTWREFALRTLALTPDHPDVLISAARAHAAAEDKAQALKYLAEAVRRGAGLDPSRFPQFTALAEDPAFKTIAAAARRNLEPIAKAVTFVELAGRESEGIAYDPVSRRFFIGHDKGGIFAIGMDGKIASFASGGGLRQLLGMKVDAERRLLWLANGRYPEPGPDQPPDSGTGGIRAYNLDTGKLVTSAELDERPLLHGFNDLALAKDGTVYVTDSPTNAIYKLAPGGKQLELLLRDSRMSFPNGIVPAADGRTLYVAHTEGISIVDPVTKARTLLPMPADGSVHGIDGLLLRDGVLYGVQNSPYMHRIVAAQLATDGKSISKVWTVNSRTPAEYIQTTAAIAGDDLYMVGGAPLPDVYGGTEPVDPKPQIWRVPLKN